MTIRKFPIQTRTVDFQQIIDAKGYADDAEAARDAAEAARTQAELAATAAGATLYDSTASGLAGTTDGDVFLVSTEPGVQVYRNDTGSDTFLGWLGRVRFRDVGAFFAHPGSFIADTLVDTVAEGFAYRAVDTATATTVENAGGQAFEVLPNERGEIALEQIGVIVETLGTTGADNTAKMVIASAMTDFTGTFTCGPGYVRTNGTFLVPRHASLICDSTVFDGEGKAGPFDEAVVLKRGASPTQIANLAADVSAGATSISFAADHNLSIGDTILLSDPNDYSYSTWRPVYREGEFAKIVEIVSSTSVTLAAPILADSYTVANTNIYHCTDMASGIMQGFSAVAPGASGDADADGLRIDFGEEVSIQNVKASNSDDASLSWKNCFRCSGHGIKTYQWGHVTGFGTQYGMVVANCQDLFIRGIIAKGDRHAITTGGFDNSFSIVNRKIDIGDFVAISKSTVLGAVDFHGNTEYSKYSNGTCYGGGVQFSGDRNSYSDIEIIGGPDGLGFKGSELVGFSHTFRNISGRIQGSGFVTRGALFDIGGANSASVLTTDTKRGGHLSIKQLSGDLPDHTKPAIVIKNWGGVFDYTASIHNVYVDQPNGASGDFIVSLEVGSGSRMRRIHITDVESPNSSHNGPLSLDAISALTKVRMDPVSGTGPVPLTAGDSFANRIETFPFEFPKTPDVTVSIADTDNDGSVKIHPHVPSATSTHATLRISTTVVGNNFANSVSRNVSWIAMLNE